MANKNVTSSFDELVKNYPNQYKKGISTDVERYDAPLEKGLNKGQVETRLSQYLFNETGGNNSRSVASIIISNTFTFFNLLSLIAGIALLIAGTTGFTNYLVLVMAVSNIAIGVAQELKSKKAIDKLSLMNEKSVKVLRDGKVVDLPLNQIVLDDIIILDLGAQVPADCILLQGDIEVNESMLTGESISIKKQIGDMLYAGSFICGGNGKLKVEKVGKETYIQKLTAKAKNYKKPNSELMNSIKLIIYIIGALIIPVAIGIFLASYHNYDSLTATTTDFIFNAQTNYAIQRTCSVVIGMIPAGMLLLTSGALAVGVIRLAKHNTLVQDLYSLEMLARVNIICLDKTGTITDGQMKVNDSVILNTTNEVPLNDIMSSMLYALDDNNPTSRALRNHFGIDSVFSPVNVMPFTSTRKLSAVTFQDMGTYVFGAPEFVLKPLPIRVERIVSQYAKMGLRVLLVAHSPNQIQGEKLPSLLKPIAIISISDNIREDAPETIKWFVNNDVTMKVISGDNPLTVKEIAKRAGIPNSHKYISLEGMSDVEVQNVAMEYTVFGRVTPEQKAVLIATMKSGGNTVAMTGDGVNDILAMKQSDCAVAFAAGSEATRNVAHLVLMDNNFSSMPKVVAEGRRVINNIKNSASLFLMKTLFTCFLALFCIALSIPYLFLPKNVLLLEFCVIGIPSFFLSLQPNNDRVKGRFIPYVLARALPGAILMVLGAIIMYTLNVMYPEEFGDYYILMSLIIVTFCGYVMLFRICQKFNWYRTILYIAMLAFAITMCLLPATQSALYDNWSEISLGYARILTIVVIVEASFPMSSWLIWIMENIFPSTKKELIKPVTNVNVIV